MADEEAPGNGGGVHEIQIEEPDVADEPQAGKEDGGSGRVQNIRLVIDIDDNTTVEIPLKGKLILQNSGCPQAEDKEAAHKEKDKEAAHKEKEKDKEAAPKEKGKEAARKEKEKEAARKEKEKKEAARKEKEKEEEKFLDNMRGWLMTVGTIFVTMAFQAALQPPAWLRTTDFLRFTQSEIDRWKHHLHGASHAAVAAAARFVPSPSPSPQAAESATAGLSRRAWAYMMCNYITFGSSLALVLTLLGKIPQRRAKLTMVGVKWMMRVIALSVVGTVALGTSEDWRFMLLVSAWAVLYAGYMSQCFIWTLVVIRDYFCGSPGTAGW